MIRIASHIQNGLMEESDFALHDPMLRSLFGNPVDHLAVLSQPVQQIFDCPGPDSFWLHDSRN